VHARVHRIAPTRVAGRARACAITAAAAPQPIFATGYHHSRREALRPGSRALSSSYAAKETAR